jgi:hypothetical protein
LPSTVPSPEAKVSVVVAVVVDWHVVLFEPGRRR